MSAKHTPGPRWNVVHATGLSDKEHEEYFRLVGKKVSGAFAVHAADAALMCIAPAMRVALQEILSIAEERSDVKDGPAGPQPNDWMRVAQMIREVMP